MIEVKSYLMGAWVAGERKSELVDPSTEEVIGSISAERPNLVPALEHARTVGGPALRALTFAERGAILKGLSKAIHTRREALIEISITSGGTTRSDAKFDIDGASGTLAYYAALGAKLGETRLLAEPSEQQIGRASCRERVS
jgi:oxepin-CoA hydrolase/3-oxo-5,6-dehydrosuberyl-CoA semialdehyde dehydrogenase